MSPALDPGGETSGKMGESTEVEGDEEVENILDASQSPVDDNRDDVPFAPPGSSSTPADITNADLVAERATALRLLHSMFGDADEDWGGAESVDSDLEREAVYASQRSNSHDTADSEVVPAAQRAFHNKSPIDQRQGAQAAVTAAAQRTTNLKDMFGPREEGV